MKANTLTIFVTSVKGEEIQIEKVCTLKQAVTLAKKEARKMINNGGLWVAINIQARASYGVESLAHIEAEKEGRRVVFSDEKPAETYAVCWGDEYKEEDGENNAIAETADESEAKEIAENESEANGCTMSVVRKSDGKVVAIYNNQPGPTNPDNTPSTMNANETRYNYLEAVTADVIDYINENNITVTNENREEIEEQLRDDLWACDSVTGNASGSYTFNRWTAEAYICHNLDLLAEAVEEFDNNMDVLKDGAEACDVTIRCYLLGQAIAAALDEVETEEEEIEE